MKFFILNIIVFLFIINSFCTSSGKVGLQRPLIKKECVNLAKVKKLQGKSKKGFIQKCIEQKVKKRKRKLNRQKRKKKENL